MKKNNPKTNLFLAFVVCIANYGFCQSVSYEDLNQFSTDISELQNSAEEFVDDKNFTLSFSMESFKIWYNDLSVTNAVYKLKDGKEWLEVTENIDLSELKFIKTILNESAGIIELIFNEDYKIRTDFYIDGTKQKTEHGSSLKIYCKGENNNYTSEANEELYSKIVLLSDRIKIQKGWQTIDNAAYLSEKWHILTQTKYPDCIDAYNQFYNQNATSVYAAEAQARHGYFKRKLERQMEIDNVVLKKYALAKESFDIGVKSYKNYETFHKAELIISDVINTYTLEELGTKRRDNFVAFRIELIERYKWNKTYFDNLSRIVEYDRLVQVALERQQKVEKVEYNNLFSGIVGGFGTTFGGIMLVVGAVTNDGALIGPGTLSLFVGLSVLSVRQIKLKILRNKAANAANAATNYRSQVGDVLDVRDKVLQGEKYNEFPLISLD